MVPLKWAWPVAIAALASPLLPARAAPDTPANDAVRWREQMERVGEFPRGHADILRWERQQQPAEAAEAPAQPPLTVDDVVRQALALHPGLVTAASPEPLAERERHLAQLALAARARQAWLDAVLAGETLRWQRARSEVADSGAELGRRMVQAGNWSVARGLREQVTQAQERIALQQAQQSERAARETLARLIGAGGGDQVVALGRRLPAQVPALPSTVADQVPASPEDVVLLADTTVAPQRIATERLLASVSGERLEQVRRARAQALTGIDPQGWPSGRIDLRDPALARDQRLDEAAEAQAALQREDAARRSQAREAWARVQDQYAQAQQTQTVLLPLLTGLEQETQRRYNGMLQNTWELLEATRERLTATAAAAQARHGYWTALLQWQLLSAGAPTKEH